VGGSQYHPISRRRLMHGAAASLLPLGYYSYLRAATPATAAETLAQDYGLVRLNGNTWTSATEIRLRETLAELPKLKESIVVAERELDERIEQNRRDWQDTVPLRKTMQVALSKLSPGDPQRTALRQKLDELARASSDPMHLAGRSEVRAKLVNLVRDRSALTLALLGLRSALAEMQPGYADLAANAAVKQSLQRLGGQQRLGPLKNYEADLKRLGEYERLVFTQSLPIYEQSGQIRMTAIVNERFPLTFTWLDASEQPTVLTAGAFDTLGETLPADAPRKSLAFPAGRKQTAREIVLPYIRFGRCVLSGVTAFVLPAEGEDLGSRLGRAAFAEHRVRIEPERLRMTID